MCCLTNDCGLLFNSPLGFLEALHLFKIEINYHKMLRLYFQLETGEKLRPKLYWRSQKDIAGMYLNFVYF